MSDNRNFENWNHFLDWFANYQSDNHANPQTSPQPDISPTPIKSYPPHNHPFPPECLPPNTWPNWFRRDVSEITEWLRQIMKDTQPFEKVWKAIPPEFWEIISKSRYLYVLFVRILWWYNTELIKPIDTIMKLLLRFFHELWKYPELRPWLLKVIKLIRGLIKEWHKCKNDPNCDPGVPEFLTPDIITNPPSWSPFNPFVPLNKNWPMPDDLPTSEPDNPNTPWMIDPDLGLPKPGNAGDGSGGGSGGAPGGDSGDGGDAGDGPRGRGNGGDAGDGSDWPCYDPHLLIDGVTERNLGNRYKPGPK